MRVIEAILIDVLAVVPYDNDEVLDDHYFQPALSDASQVERPRFRTSTV